jgi:Receptor L domain
MKPIMNIAVLCAFLGLIAICCNNDSDFFTDNDGDNGFGGGPGGMTSCASYCEKESVCDSEWFDITFGSVSGCVSYCEEGKDYSETLICFLGCNTAVNCADWFSCQNNCFGGSSDADADGDADADTYCESYDSDKVYDYGFTVVNGDDRDEINSYACIGGDLEIDGEWLTTLKLPNLKVIGGDLIIQETPLESIAMTNLKTIGGDLDMGDNSWLASVNFSDLTTIDGYYYGLYISDNPSLTTLEFNSLKTAEGGVSIHTNTGLTSIVANGLEEIGDDLEIYSNNNLSLISMKNLHSIDRRFDVYSNAALPTCEATGLRDQLIETDAVCIYDNLADDCDDDVSGCE